MHEPFVSQIYGQNLAHITTGSNKPGRGGLVRHHRVLCLILTSATQPTWRECCIYWRNNQTYKVYSKLSITTSGTSTTACAVRVAPPRCRGAQCSN